MTIGFLINTCEPFYRGGYERRTWAFARELVRQGHEVRIYTSCPKDEILEGVRFVRLTSPRPYFNRRGVRNGYADVFFTASILKLFSKLQSRELDVLDVCATPFLHLPFIAWIGRWKRIPLTLTCHEALLAGLGDYVRERGHRTGLVGERFASLLAAMYRFGMKSVANKIAVSSRTADALETEGFPARATVEFGLEKEDFSLQAPTTPTGPIRFVSCGRLTPIKNVGTAIDALLQLREEGKRFHFDIIGDGAQRAHLEQKVAWAKAEDMIFFRGEISEEAKRELLARSEIFILSSPREGFSIATLEAMAQGCAAVVVADPQQANGALDFVRDVVEGLHVLPGVEGMAAALRKLSDEPGLRCELRKAARATAENYRIENQTRRLVAAYAEMTGR